MNRKYWLPFFVLLLLMAHSSFAQQSGKPRDTKPTAKPPAAAPKLSDKEIIDSLSTRILQLEEQNRISETALINERAATADLRDQVIKLDDYRMKLEQTVSSFKGENLHLNQSNRILIIFNAMVAVLLLVTLVYFLRRLGRKSTDGMNNSTKPNANNQAGQPPLFEDKIAMLERLGKLREKGMLSDDEFMSEKNRLFGKQ